MSAPIAPVNKSSSSSDVNQEIALRQQYKDLDKKYSRMTKVCFMIVLAAIILWAILLVALRAEVCRPTVAAGGTTLVPPQTMECIEGMMSIIRHALYEIRHLFGLDQMVVFAIWGFVLIVVQWLGVFHFIVPIMIVLGALGMQRE